MLLLRARKNAASNKNGVVGSTGKNTPIDPNATKNNPNPALISLVIPITQSPFLVSYRIIHAKSFVYYSYLVFIISKQIPQIQSIKIMKHPENQATQRHIQKVIQ